jgi:2-polyprenyl-3-methyl-5-hydroxy-6-metoxy-1,4-benzoquinol methylase
VRDRFRKQGLYDSKAYWNQRAESYEGLAKSNWPSNVYNELVHARQMQRIDQSLGNVTGLHIADVGCGTGRTSLHLARRGAQVTGFDFSDKALVVAREAAQKEGLAIRFETHDVMSAPAEAEQRAYDVVMTVGCLALACRDAGDFVKALRGLTSMVRPGGRLLLLEPAHGNRLLARILKLDVERWIELAEQAGLTLLERDGVCFVPGRYALAFRDLPRPIAEPLFQGGERLLDLARRFEPLADYKLLLFRART